MKRKTVESSNLKSIGYDEAIQVLEVEFRNGRMYQYSGVPKTEYQNLLNADSVGTYFNDNIKASYRCIPLQ